MNDSICIIGMMMSVDAVFLQSKFNRKLMLMLKQTVEWALGNRY